MCKDPSSSSKKHDIFNIEELRQLMELMKENNISEIDLQQNKSRIQLRRNIKLHEESQSVLSIPQPAAMIPVASVQAPPTVSTPPVEETAVQYIKSPMVGTFYASANPDSAPFIQIGDHVNPEKTVCIVEAMKVFNEIQAEFSGKIVEILVKNGDAVEYGTPLFKVSQE